MASGYLRVPGARNDATDKTDNSVTLHFTNEAADVRIVGDDSVPPSRKLYQHFFFGTDANFSDPLTAGSYNNGLWGEIREINSDHRSVVIQCEGTSSIDFDVKVFFSRAASSSHEYEITSLASTANTTQWLQVNIPASVGYDYYMKVQIRPETGQTGNNLNFKCYLAGRGG